ncbi:MAG TPA: ParB/RepB/Spo0J family partition protein [Bacillota bacterium]|nr:ParB/RepB/Spo0J family partition protein [Peptococcaceae bacterium MAG4]NLW38061.1 ParB/RepB/Spo0J family partition protein [Peptococcaceae bacterium]HPZ44162.1 ParB/RepB/Spo0J family partition protein [Bacillota bacterium]HQD76648.1 ParB/RepB/Spo0J family partition protein [Bacillota bacterium]HUM59424.1 ParB/RepB/Spo0J family partition protein [Bacillota bacterium]
MGKQRRGLGKGLQALIQSTEESGGSDRLKEIDIDEIKLAPHQPRQMFDPDKLAELAASIKKHGVIQPIVVRPLQSGGYELIAGERRWRACKSLGYRKIPAVVKECQDLEASAVSLIENIQREDLNPLEEALAYHQLMDNYGLTQEEVSERVGKSRSFVANMVRLLGLPNEVKDMLASGQLNAGHARALLAIQDGKKQVAAAGKIVRLNLNVRQAESMARALSQKKDKQKKRETILDEDRIEVEAKLKNRLRATVKLKEKAGGRGILEIHFKGEQELQRILGLLMGDKE